MEPCRRHVLGELLSMCLIVVLEVIAGNRTLEWREEFDRMKYILN